MAKRRGANDGSIYQRPDGRWVATVETGYVDGKRRRKYLYGNTRQEVQKKLRKAQTDIEQGLPLPDDRLTVGAFLDAWLEQAVLPKVRASTYRSYEELVRLHIKSELGQIRLAKLTARMVQTFLNAKLNDGRYSPRRVQYMHAVLRRALNIGVRWGVIGRNVATLVDPPRARRPEVDVLSPEEVGQLLAAAEGHRLGALVTLAVSLGLRRENCWGCVGKTSIWMRDTHRPARAPAGEGPGPDTDRAQEHHVPPHHQPATDSADGATGAEAATEAGGALGRAGVAGQRVRVHLHHRHAVGW